MHTKGVVTMPMGLLFTKGSPSHYFANELYLICSFTENVLRFEVPVCDTVVVEEG